jgi:hypothetical protein
MISMSLSLLPLEAGECPNSHSIPELNIYGAQRRYEEGLTPATEDDASEVATMASDALH